MTAQRLLIGLGRELGKKLETELKHCDVQNSDFELFLLGHQRNVFFSELLATLFAVQMSIWVTNCFKLTTFHSFFNLLVYNDRIWLRFRNMLAAIH